MNAFKEFDDFEDEQTKHKPTDNDGRSLKDMLREKRETTEKHLDTKS